MKKDVTFITFPSSFVVVVVVVDPFVEDPYTAEFDMVDCDETASGMSFGYPYDGRYCKDERQVYCSAKKKSKVRKKKL
jgi:hypothetical protein